MAFTAPTFQLSEAAIVGSSADENMYHHASILENVCWNVVESIHWFFEQAMPLAKLS